MDIDADAETAERFPRCFLDGAFVDETIFAVDGILKPDVLGDGHFPEQCQVLPDHLDAERLRQRGCHGRDRLAVEEELGALLWLVDPRDDLDERALAAAVLPRQAMHLPRVDFKRHALQRAHAAEGHLDVLE